MWVLETPDSDALELTTTARLLSPGSTTNLGRNEANDIVLGGAKSVSKQHLTLRVEDLSDDLCSNIQARSSLIIEDQGSKFGTYIIHDSTELKITEAYRPDHDRFSFRLGRQQDLFLVYWQPISFVLSGIKSRDVVKDCRELDLRYSKEYDSGCTHVLTTKIRTPKVLQGLIEGKFIVTDVYFEALREALSRPKQDVSVIPSATDTAFIPDQPSEGEYQPALLYPRSDRRTVFSGLTFVVFETAQAALLKSMIEAGAGEVGQYRGDDTLSDIQSFLQRYTKPVIVMPREAYSMGIVNEVLTKCKVPSLLQGEFLEAILSDGQHAIFQRTTPVAIEDSVGKHIGQAPDTIHMNHEPIAGSQSQTQSRRIGSRAIHSLVNLDLDIFGADSEPDVVMRQPSVPRTPRRPLGRKANVPVHIVPIADEDLPGGEHPSSGLREQQGRSQRQMLAVAEEAESPQVPWLKRVREPSPPEQAFEIAPAAAAFLKENRRTRQKTKDSDLAIAEGPAEQPRKSRRRDDITEEEIAATLQRNKARAEAQSQPLALSDPEDGDDLRNLGTVEYFPLMLNDGASKHPASQSAVDKWKGRKNFKLFRRRGQTTATKNGAEPGVMIRLVESKPSDRGLFDKEWLDTAAIRGETESNRRSLHNTPYRGDGQSFALDSQRNTNGTSQGGLAGTTGMNFGGLFFNDDSDSDDDPARFRM